MGDRPGERAEVVVVGAGIIGLAVAYELLRRGRKVLVLERALHGGGATSASGGMLAPVSEADVQSPDLVRFGLDSLGRYPRLVADLEDLTGSSCGYRADGAIWAASNRDDLEELDHLEATLRLKSLGCTRLEPGEVLEREPHLSGRILGGLLLADDHQVDPRALSHGLVKAIGALGGRILTDVRVREIATAGGKVRSVLGSRDGESAGFEVGCEAAVLAAGAWSSHDIRSPLEGLGVRPVKGQLVRLKGGPLLRHVVRNPSVYLVPREDGELLIGATMEERGFDTSATAGAVLDLLRHAWQLLPGIDELRLVEVSVGLRSAVRDHLPVIGATGTGGLYVATGHFRNGILLAPATAHYLAETMASGRPAPELALFAPDRLGTSGGAAEG